MLFGDLTGFTTLSERLDPEEVRAFQNALFNSLSLAITRYDGFVAKFLGDAVLRVLRSTRSLMRTIRRVRSTLRSTCWPQCVCSASTGTRALASRCLCTSPFTPGMSWLAVTATQPARHMT